MKRYTLNSYPCSNVNFLAVLDEHENEVFQVKLTFITDRDSIVVGLSENSDFESIISKCPAVDVDYSKFKTLAGTVTRTFNVPLFALQYMPRMKLKYMTYNLVVLE